MAVAENIDRVRQAFSAYNGGDVEGYSDLYADPVIVVNAATEERREESRTDGIAATRAFRDSFPDHRCTIQRITAEGNRVVVRYQNEATHAGSGPFGEPTGKQASWGSFSEYQFEGGVVVEVAFVSDTLSLLKQLGFMVLPPASEG